MAQKSRQLNEGTDCPCSCLSVLGKAGEADLGVERYQADSLSNQFQRLRQNMDAVISEILIY